MSSPPETTRGAPAARRPGADWHLRQPFGTRTLVALLAASLLLAITGRHVQVPAIFTSPIGKGLTRFGSQAFPLVIAEETPLSRRPELERDHLPWLSHIERREKTTSRFDVAENRLVETTESEEVLVEPVGYLVYVCEKMRESLELALWGTIFALVIGLPLACLGARGYAPTRLVYGLSRLASSVMRAVPELVSALVLTLAYGFGPMAGVVALAFHSAGFFGKFFADDIENADRAPQEALLAAGANRLKVLRRAVLPQVLPQYIAYTQYILERNVRMATAIGVVGAGGIGIELKGRFDTYDFGHVSTIIFVILVTVLLLEQLSQRLRGRIIATG
jgi:phosphonate transport system permease protein